MALCCSRELSPRKAYRRRDDEPDTSPALPSNNCRALVYRYIYTARQPTLRSIECCCRCCLDSTRECRWPNCLLGNEWEGGEIPILITKSARESSLYGRYGQSLNYSSEKKERVYAREREKGCENAYSSAQRAAAVCFQRRAAHRHSHFARMQIALSVSRMKSARQISFGGGEGAGQGKKSDGEGRARERRCKIGARATGRGAWFEVDTLLLLLLRRRRRKFKLSCPVRGNPAGTTRIGRVWLVCRSLARFSFYLPATRYAALSTRF